MSIRIALDSPPEFYTNLDTIQGRVVLGLNRHEQVGAIIVKLEGESKTALGVPSNDSGGQSNSGPSGNIIHENHKILYKVAQVFPDETTPAAAAPIILAPGQHEYPFLFKVPFNNACGDPAAMASIGGLAGQGGPAFFGLGGIRVMDGSKQLLYSHVTKTLPPSFTGFPREAEIRYYIKVTIQRPGLFKENWRYQIGFKFLPIEPPRPARTNQEAYARRPFTFHPRSPSPELSQQNKRSSFLAGWRPNKDASPDDVLATTPGFPMGGGDSKPQPPSPTQSQTPVGPSIEMSARLPHPSILTCNQPVPLRLIAKKLVPAPEDVFLISLQIDLIGLTIVRCQDLVHTETTRWVVLTRHGLSILVSQAADPIGTETVVPAALWCDIPLPNTVMPTFATCNLGREYQLEVKLGLSWGKPPIPEKQSNNPFFKSKARIDPDNIPQTLHLPLQFTNVEVYSGLAPPAALVEAMRQGRAAAAAAAGAAGGRRKSLPGTFVMNTYSRPGPPPSSSQQLQQQQPPQRPPRIPPRPTPQQAATLHQIRPHDPLHPPQLGPGDVNPPYRDAPPSYDEAMAEATGPVVPHGTERPAYSGVTNENDPSTIPEKT